MGRNCIGSYGYYDGRFMNPREALLHIKIDRDMIDDYFSGSNETTKKQVAFVYLETIQGVLLEEMYKNPYFKNFCVITDGIQDNLKKLHEQIEDATINAWHRLTENLTQEEYVELMNMAYGHADNIIDEVLGDKKYRE